MPSELEEELIRATDRRLGGVFRSPDGRDEETFPHLARICRTVAPEIWDEDPTRALLLTVRKAIKGLSETNEDGSLYKPAGCETTWRRIAETLCGFRKDLPPRPDGQPHGYKDFCKIAFAESKFQQSKRTFQRRVTAQCRKLLADQLEAIEGEVRRTGVPINNLDYAERASSSKITVTEEVAAASTSSVPIEVPPDVEKRSGYELTAARSAGPEKSEPPSPYVRRKSWTPVTLIGVASVSVAIFIAWELWPSGNSAKPSDSTGQHALAGTATSPLTVKAITPLDPDPNPDASFVLPGKQAFSQPQLTSIRSQELHENESFQKWLQSKNGTLITSQTRFNVTVQSNSKSEVVVTDIRIVKNCHAPTGTLFHVPTQGGGPIPTVKLYFSLRDRDPHAKDADTDKPYFAQNTISLLPGESSTFNMDVQFLPDMQCDFTFKIEVATPEKSELSVDNNGRPFRLYDLGDFKGYQTLYATGGPKNVTPFNPVNPASYNGLGSPSVYSNSTAIPAPPKP